MKKMAEEEIKFIIRRIYTKDVSFESPLSPAVFDDTNLSPKISFNLANRISKSSSDYNHNDKFINIIMNDISDYAKTQWNSSNIVMVGHYHQQKIIKEKEGVLIFLGDWLTKFSVTTLSENGIWQGNWDEFIKKLA